MTYCKECYDLGMVVKQNSMGEKDIEMCLCKSYSSEWLIRYGIK